MIANLRSTSSAASWQLATIEIDLTDTRSLPYHLQERDGNQRNFDRGIVMVVERHRYAWIDQLGHGIVVASYLDPNQYLITSETQS